MDAMDFFLKIKYAKKVEKCKKKILSKYPELEDASEYTFTRRYPTEILLFHEGKQNLAYKAYCCGKRISIDEMILRQNEDDLTEVILHELLHVNYTWKSEDEVIYETNKKMRNLISFFGKSLNNYKIQEIGHF